MFSLMPRIDRITQGIKAGKQRTRKFTLVGTPLGDAHEPAGRRERFRVAFPWLHARAGLCASPAERGAGSCLASCSNPRQRSVGTNEAQASPGKADPHSRLLYHFAEIRKLNSCSYLHSFWISGIEDFYLQRCCTKFSHASHS